MPPSTVHRPPSTVHRWLVPCACSIAVGAVWLLDAEAVPAPYEGPYQEAVSWAVTGEAPVLGVDGAPGAPVTVRYRAILAELEHSWEDSGELDGSGRLDLPVKVPAEVWMHPASADFVTDLVVRVTFDGHRTVGPVAVVAWPDGEGGLPHVWTQEEAAVLAPHGTLRADLRKDLEPDDRLMPDVSDVAPSHEVPSPERDSGDPR